MRRLLPLLLFAAVALSAAPAAAQSSFVHLRWDDCSAYGQPLRTFACNVNTGNHVLVASFRSPMAMDHLVEMECLMEVLTNSPTLPNWWSLRVPGSCRPSSLTMSADFTLGPSHCFDYWMGQAVSSIAAYNAGYYGSNTARLAAFAAISNTAVHHLDADVETYVFKILIGNQKSVGAGACSGCDVAAALQINSLKLNQEPGYGDLTISTSDEMSFASWQCPVILGGHGPPYFYCVTPTIPKSWGRIKALYR